MDKRQRPHEAGAQTSGAIQFTKFPVFQKPLPLKIGIREDLVAIGYEPEAVQRFLRRWCSQPEYQAALVSGGSRYDLDGQVCGAIPPEHREIARAQLEAKLTKDKQKSGKTRKPKAWDGLKTPKALPVTKTKSIPSAGKQAALERLQKAVAGTRPTLSLKGGRS